MPKPRRIEPFDLNKALTQIQKDTDSTPLAFGKHKGLTPKEIADIDPNYIVWAFENLDNKPCTPRLYEMCLTGIEEGDFIEQEESFLNGILRFK